ncbi:MAG: PepSY domain-containing protein [Methanobacterium sp. ERen5]|nr:MAG: PepSY domain-containing protein [Methanobacterium sp. ERen5]
MGVVVIIIFLYAYFAPFGGTPNNVTQPQVTSTGSVTPITFVSPSNNNSNNTTSSGNLTKTAAQAQDIALKANPGYLISSTTQATLNDNGKQISVWNLTLSKDQDSKTVYVDASNGNIVTV